MVISIIAAIAQFNEIGLNNKLLWNIPDDLKIFKEKTLNKVVVCGKNTFISIYEQTKGNLLPNREIAVISTTFKPYENIKVFNNIKSCLEFYSNEDEIFIIGGQSIYKQTINIADNLYITKIPKNYIADSFFPHIDTNLWSLISTQKIKSKILKNITFEHWKKLKQFD
jgi:dihydrofolate reductase